MLRSILNLQEVQILEKQQQREINAGNWYIDCSLSQNLQHPCCIVGSSVCG